MPNIKSCCSYLFVFSLLLIAHLSIGQSVPTLFEPTVISKGGMFGLTLSPDAKIALWVSSSGKRDTLKIMESRKVAGVWSEPVVASFSTANGAWKDIDPIFTPNGKAVLFQSNRNTGRASDRKDFDLWAVALTSSGWGEPYRLGGAINTEASESFASATDDGTIYFMKDDELGVGSSDIYFSRLGNKTYQKPQNLGAPVNTAFRESNPYISPKGDFLIYFSSDSTGFGEVDLYISFFKKGKWSAPKNLGAPINTAVAEFCPFYQEREKKLYFSRQTKQNGPFIEETFSVDFNPKDYR